MKKTLKIVNGIKAIYLKEVKLHKKLIAEKSGIKVQTIDKELSREGGVPSFQKMLERLEIVGYDPASIIEKVA